jgi:hypothetical protein
MAVMGDSGDFLPSGPAAHKSASEAEIAEMKHRLERGLSRGAVAVGFGIAYTPEATQWEILEGASVINCWSYQYKGLGTSRLQPNLASVVLVR